MAHSHGSHAAKSSSRLMIVLGLSAVVFVAELVAGLLTNSLALVADAGHVLSDVAAMFIALIAIRIAQRPATLKRTFGYQRMEIFAAAANAAILFVIAGSVLVEAWRRFGSTPEIETGPMIAVAAAGLAVNVLSAFLLHGAAKESLNMRGAYLEVLGDAAGSVAVITAGAVIAVTGLVVADTIASAAIGVFILPRAWSLLREALDVLLEASPKGTDLSDVRQHILEAPGVVAVHDLHAWTITSGLPVLSAHVVLEPGAESQAALDHLCECLSDCFDIEHSTFQLEHGDRRHREPAIHA